MQSEYTIRDIFFIFKKRLIPILLITLFAGGISFLGSKFLITPQYESSASLFIRGNSSDSSVYNDVAVSQKLVDTYAVILKNPSFLSQVIQKQNLNISPSALSGKIAVSAIGSSGIFRLSVRDSDPVFAQQTVDAILELAPHEIRRTIKVGELEIISPSQKAQYISPNIKNNTVTGAFMGAVLACIGALLLEFLSNKFKTEEDIKSKLNYPVIGTIPDCPLFRTRNVPLPLSKRHFKTERTQSSSVPFFIEEAFRTLRFNLKYSSIDTPLKKIMVTSSLPGEGKTMITLQLASSLSHLGNKVLVIDMDFRKSTAYKHILPSGSNQFGVSTVLTDSSSLKDSIFLYEELGIYILRSGPIPPNPNELLQSQAVRTMIESLEYNFDYILIDTPPLSSFSDALALLSVVDGTLFVVRQNYTPFDTAITVKNNLENVNAHVVGCVLNGYKDKINHRGYPSYYAYKK